MGLKCKLTLYVCVLLYAEAGSKIFPCGNKKCVCYKNNDILEMNCTRQEINNVEEILDDVPVNTTILDLGWNNISLLEDSTFGNCKNLNHLQVLNLTHNKIKTLHTLAFKGLAILKIFDISFNSIPFLSHGSVPAIFKPLLKLSELYIQNNTVDESTNMAYPDDILSDAKSLETLQMDGIANATFGPGFKELRKLTTLNISGLNGYCKIHTLKNDTFRYLSSVKHLNISYCGLSVIEADALSPLYQLNSVDMSGNKDLGYLALPNVFFGLRNTPAETLIYSSMFHSRMGTELKVKHLQRFNETKIKNFYAEDNTLEMLENDVFNHFPKTLTYLSVRSNRIMVGDWIFQLKKLANLEVIDGSYQYRSRIPDIVWPDKFYIDKNRHIRSASVRCYDMSAIFPENLKKIFCVGSKQEYIIPCIKLSNKFEEIRIQGNIFHSWQGPITGLANLKVLDLSRNYCSDISPDFFSDGHSIQELYVNTNFIGLVLKKDEGIFKDLTNLRILDLSFNVISTLPSNVFEQQVHLESLDLNTNGLMNFEINLEHMKNLTYLNIAANSLSTLPVNVRNYIGKRKKENTIKVDMSDNPIKCTCKRKDFVYWLAEHRDAFIGFQKYTFLDEDGAKIKNQDFDKAIEKMKKRCVETGSVLIISVVSCVSLLTIIILCTIYRYRWKLRYLYYMTKSKYRGYSRVHGSDTFDDYRYDAFISYAGEELLFIKNELVKELEDRRNLNLSVHQRDFMAGNPIAENIVDAVTNSRKTVLILTDNFLKSDWCMYELRMAQMESNYSRDGRDIFVIVMLENIPNDSMPLDLLRLIQSQTYIEYPVNPQDRELFWNQVKDAILQVE